MARKSHGAKTPPPRRAKAEFRFTNARLCFAFTETLGHRGKPEPTERLQRPADLARWCVESGSVRTAPACTDADLARAKALREAIQRVGEAVATGASAAADDIAAINRAAARPSLAPALGVDGASVRWRGDGLDAVLSLVARDLIAVCGSPLRDRLRLCENETCGSPFIDTSRAGERRWCSMSLCGALAKKRAYRARQRAAASHEA